MIRDDDLSFDPRTHVYRLRGIPIPSVTHVMQPLSRLKYEGIDPEILNRAAQRGTDAHSAIEFFLKYGVKECTEEARPYFDAFMKWYQDYKPHVFLSEEMTYHPQLVYAGTIDLLAHVDCKKTLIDFKTTMTINDMLTTVQLEAYNRMLAARGHGADQKAILLLKPDASYTFKTYPESDLEAWKTFTSLLQIRAHILKYGG